MKNCIGSKVALEKGWVKKCDATVAIPGLPTNACKRERTACTHTIVESNFLSICDQRSDIEHVVIEDEYPPSARAHDVECFVAVADTIESGPD